MHQPLPVVVVRLLKCPISYHIRNDLLQLFEDLSIYLGKNPKYGEKYPDHYFDLLSWAKKDEKDREKAEAAPKPAPPQQPMTTYQRLKAMGEL